MRLKKNELHLLETGINNIDQLITNNNDDDFLLNGRSELKNKLDALLTEKTIGYQIRSKSKWIEEGEKNTAYFLNLEKNRQSQSVIKKNCRNQMDHLQKVRQICLKK